MLLITHGAMKKFQHGIKEDDVIELFDKYQEQEGAPLVREFLADTGMTAEQIDRVFQVVKGHVYMPKGF